MRLYCIMRVLGGGAMIELIVIDTHSSNGQKKGFVDSRYAAIDTQDRKKCLDKCLELAIERILNDHERVSWRGNLVPKRYIARNLLK